MGHLHNDIFSLCLGLGSYSLEFIQMIKWYCPTCKASFEDKTVEGLVKDLELIKKKIDMIFEALHNQSTISA